MKLEKSKNAIIYCEGSFNTPNGKTAHGLVRYTERYNIIAVLDSKYDGKDSGLVLDNKKNDIPILKDLKSAIHYAEKINLPIKNFIIGLAPDGGRFPLSAIEEVKAALKNKLNIISGLHDFLSDNNKLKKIASENGCELIDIRKPPSRDKLHFFSGNIERVDSLKIAVLGSDSAVGKRTTAWLIIQALRKIGHTAELIGTGQTAWLQGAKYSIVLDSLVNDFVSGEIEHAVFQAWINENPDVIVLEGQGSIMNPAYPGGFELLAAGRPDFVILQHAPKRIDYDGFPGYRIQPLKKQIKAIELISGKKIIAVTINHEGILKKDIASECKKISKETGLPAFDVLVNGADELAGIIKTKLRK